jgi:hypothetical protein
MAVMTLHEELEDVLTNRLKYAFRTGEIINVPDWVSEIARVLALAVVLVDEEDLPGLTEFAHAELDRCVAEEWADRQTRDAAGL